MKKLITSITMIAFAIALSTSCKKSNDAPATPVDILMNKNWKITAGTVSPAFMGETNFYNLIPTCDHDNLTKFMASEVLVYDDGAIKCDPQTPQSETGTWSYDASAKKIILSMPDPIDFYVLELTNTTLRGTNTAVIGGTTYTYNTTFTAQ